MSIRFEQLFDLPTPQQTGRPRRRLPIRLWLLILGAFVLLGLTRTVVGLVVDAWWFASLGQSAVFRLSLLMPWAVFGAVGLVGLGWLALNWLPWGARDGAPARAWLLMMAALAALPGAVRAAAAWQAILLSRQAVGFAQQDPVLGRDLGAYVFQLPVWRLGQGLVQGWVLIALVGVLLLQGLRQLSGGGLVLQRGGRRGQWRVSLGPQGKRPALDGGRRRHVYLLGAAFALCLAWSAYLGRFELVSGQGEGIVAGPGYTDIVWRLPVLGGLVIGWLAVAALALVGAFGGPRRLPLVAAAVVLGMRIVGVGLLPALVQAYRVVPNELSVERPYLERAIQGTRAAWGLDQVQRVSYQPGTRVEEAAVRADQASLGNIRLWDWRVFLDYLDQMQAIRPYYQFPDVDIDRYPGPQGPRQVELAARELRPAGLRNPTWISRHLEYTHGFGLALAPVDAVDRRGQPELWVRDLPPVVKPELGRELKEPRIYFGEGEGHEGYAIVASRAQEFDYPKGEENARTVYAGADGLPIGGWGRRLAFALHLGDLELLLSQDLLPQSRLLLHREVHERLAKLAPFLIIDPDPYIVLTEEGRLVWMIDAYTATDRRPYAQALRLPEEAGGQRVNHLRNSVKIALDAYDGRPTFYLIDETDPIARAWQGIFPELLRPAAEMPEGLKPHWRYPEALFRAQAQMLERYHLTRPEVFYNGEDLWTAPQETRAQGSSVAMDPYYVTLTLRGEKDPEFVLMRPFTPAGKKNMNAWLAARSDPGHYGELVVYDFGKGQQVDGPEQVEARIDNNTDISAQLTLWSQAGSRTIRGNLLALPVGESFLYVEPLYLQAESNALPELKRVIVADGERVVMRERFDEALAALLADGMPPVVAAEDEAEAPAGAPATGASETPTDADADAAEDAPAGAPLPTDLPGLIRAARAAEAEAGRALEAGDWQGFGAAMARLSEALREMEGVEEGEGAP